MRWLPGLVLISPATTDPLVTERGLPHVNRLCGRDAVQGAAAAEFAASLKTRRAYVVHERDHGGAAVAERFRQTAERLGMAVLAVEGTTETEPIGTLHAAIRARAPDVVFLAGDASRLAGVARGVREGGLAARVIGSGGRDMEGWREARGAAVAGLHYTTIGGPVAAEPPPAEFAAAYRRRFDRDPGPIAAHAYDAAAVAVRAIETTIHDAPATLPARGAVVDAVRRIRHQGITGPIEFDQSGDRNAVGYVVWRVSSSEPVGWGDATEAARLGLAPPARR